MIIFVKNTLNLQLRSLKLRSHFLIKLIPFSHSHKQQGPESATWRARRGGERGVDLSRPTGLGTQPPTDHPQLPTYPASHSHPAKLTYTLARPDLPTHPANLGTHPEGMGQVVGGKQPAESQAGRLPPCSLPTFPCGRSTNTCHV